MTSRDPRPPESTSPPTRQARRLHRPAWRDPRLAIGLALVACSVALGAWVVDRATHTTSLYVAGHAILPGETLDPAQLDVVEVGGALDPTDYLGPQEQRSDPLIATRPIGEGEIIPRSALASEASSDARPVSLSPDTPTTASVERGDSVDLWYLPDPNQPDAAPRLVAEALMVADVRSTSGTLGSGGDLRIDVLVPLGSLPDVLAVATQTSRIAVVEVPRT